MSIVVKVQRSKPLSTMDHGDASGPLTTRLSEGQQGTHKKQFNSNLESYPETNAPLFTTMYHPAISTFATALSLLLCISVVESRISYVRVSDQEQDAAPHHRPLEGFDVHADSEAMLAMREYFDISSSYSMSLSMPILPYRTTAPVAVPVAPLSKAPVAAPVAITPPTSIIASSEPTATEIPSTVPPTAVPSLRGPPPKVEEGPNGKRGTAFLSNGGRVALITVGTGVVCATALLGVIVWGRRQSA